MPRRTRGFTPVDEETWTHFCFRTQYTSALSEPTSSRKPERRPRLLAHEALQVLDAEEEHRDSGDDRRRAGDVALDRRLSIAQGILERSGSHEGTSLYEPVRVTALTARHDYERERP